MENMVVKTGKLFGSVYNNRSVLVTGHTGFKGSWLVTWLKILGAKVGGYALPPDTEPSHYNILKPDMDSFLGDIIDNKNLSNFIDFFKPEIVFHLAAQPIVRVSYKEPVYTFQTNIMGTVNLLECCRKSASVKNVIVITTDKVYENDDRISGYDETARIGGFDPYSTSKANVELICNSYRRSFFNGAGKLLATARAGNVIGGGDWAEYRLIPDIIRAIYYNKELEIRNPDSIRPWQHVLEPLAGYLQLGWYLTEGMRDYEGAWNFGPNYGNCISVSELLNLAGSGSLNIAVNHSEKNYYETRFLKLDSSKAREKLGWIPLWDIKKSVHKTLNWYESFYHDSKIMTMSDIEQYINDAREAKLNWVG